MKKIGFFTLVILLCAASQAQYRFGYFRAGLSVGATNYLGDLDDDITFKFTKPGVGLIGAFRFNPHMEARFNVYQGWLGATDRNSIAKPRENRNLSFRSPVTEASFTMAYSLFGIGRGYRFRPKFNPYVFAGVGIFKFNPQAKLNNQWYDLQPLGTEGQYLSGNSPSGKPYPKPYALTQVCMPVGGGVQIMLNKNWDLFAELGWRKTFTDYLDDVSSRYPDLNALAASNPIAATLSNRGYPSVARYKRGDNKQYDWYVYSNVTASYIIDWVKCPKFKPFRGKRF